MFPMVKTLGTKIFMCLDTLNVCYSVWTKRSARLFVAGWYGLDLTCLMLFKARNLSNPAEVN